MRIRLKDNVNPEELRKFGFKPGKEWANQGEKCLVEYEYQHGWYHNFKMEKGNPDKIEYSDEVYGRPMASLCFRVGDGNVLYIECVIGGASRIGGSDLDLCRYEKNNETQFLSDTIQELTLAGLIERC